MGNRVLKGVVGVGLETLGRTMMATGIVTIAACTMAGIRMRSVQKLAGSVILGTNPINPMSYVIAIVMAVTWAALGVGYVTALGIDFVAARMDYWGWRLALAC